MAKVKKFILDLFEKLGVIPSVTQDNQPCYDKYGRFLGWYSRSMAVALFPFCKDNDGDWCVLASERGVEAADFRGLWNCVCGYLDRNETTVQAALRELKEEVGVTLNESDIQFVGYEDSINANRQNVTFRFCSFIEDRKTSDFSFSKEGNEGKEVGEISWIKVNEIDNYKWAFGHEKRIKEIFSRWQRK